MSNVTEITRMIISSGLTNEELNDVINAVKFARAQLSNAAGQEFRTKVGSSVKFRSSRTGQDVTGTLTKVARKFGYVNAGFTRYKVPLAMLETA